MSSKRRVKRAAARDRAAQVEREHVGKHKHASKTEAMAHVISLKHARTDARRVEAYKCSVCSGWHVGNRPSRRKKR